MIPQRRVHELAVKAAIKTTKQQLPHVEALIDSGCTHTCISKKLVQQEQLPTKQMKTPITVANADGSQNKEGQATESVKLEIEIQGHKECINAPVIGVEDQAGIFLGHDWLTQHNPEIDWNHGTIRFTRCPPSCNFPHKTIPFPPKL
jgi:hypothetical protein